jgi:hypothetical protein
VAESGAHLATIASAVVPPPAAPVPSGPIAAPSAPPAPSAPLTRPEATAPMPAPTAAAPAPMPAPGSSTVPIYAPAGPTAPMPPPAAVAPLAPAPMPAPFAAAPPSSQGPSTALPLRAPADSPPVAHMPYVPPDDPSAMSLRIERPIADLVRVSLDRAFRKRLDPALVLPGERQALTTANPPILDAGVQAFLAWRRSVLLIVACALVPLVILRAIDVFATAGTPAAVRGLDAVPVAAEAGFAGLCFWLLGHWTDWRRQRRLLLGGFLLAFAAPFVVYLIPIRSLIGGEAGQAAGLLFSIQALLVVAPRALAAMPGVIRGAIVAKWMRPQLAAPGWLMVLAAPLSLLIAGVVLLVPYQISGSGFFVATLLALAASAYATWRAAWPLTRPQAAEEVSLVVAQGKNTQLGALIGAAGFALLALAELTGQLHLGSLTVVTTVAWFAIEVLVLTLITADGILAVLGDP